MRLTHIMILIVVVGLLIGVPGGAFRERTAQAGPGNGAIARCQPLNASGPFGQDLAVDIYVQDVTDLYGADVRLSFDTSIAQVVDADSNLPGVQIQPLATFMVPGFVIKKEADNTAGTVWYAATQINPSPPVSGSGPLARVIFRAVAPGSFTLAVTSAQLSAAGGIPIPVTTMDCSVTFNGGASPTNTPTPTPTPTPTSTATWTPSPTPTSTATWTSSPTTTATSTGTPSPTFTATPTSTWTPVTADIGILRGVVFDDLNRDGIRQPEEPGLPGVSVRAILQEGVNQGQFWETRTVSNGSYILFLPAGSYLARQTNLPFWVSTTPDEALFVITAGGQVIQIDFGDHEAERIWLPVLLVTR